MLVAYQKPYQRVRYPTNVVSSNRVPPEGPRYNVPYVDVRNDWIAIPVFGFGVNVYAQATIQAKYIYTVPNTLGVSFPDYLSLDYPSNFVLCVGYFDNFGVYYRYKLRQDDDCLIYVSLYTGERLPATFVLEVWSKGSQAIYLTEDYLVRLSTKINSVNPYLAP